ncbi:tumor necrosis factor receptor superfamily member 17-like [Arapaima gigas]
MAKGKCAKNSYYDGLVEMCKPCYLRCSNSPPVSCTSYCTKSSESAVPENNNVWVILVVFLLLNAFTTMLLLVHVLRKKRCRQTSVEKVLRLCINLILSSFIVGSDQDQVADPGGEEGSDAAKRTETANDAGIFHWKPVLEEENSDSQYNSSLPLPSTEEGTTILVTTKTAQTYNYTPHCTEDKTLGVSLWGSVCVS